MPNEVQARYSKGQRLKAADWNRLAQTVEGHDRLVTSGGILNRRTGTALEIYDPRQRPFDARIGEQSGGAYAWEQVQQFEGGVYETPAGARSGTTTSGPAYARSGSDAVAEGTYVVLWPQFGGLFYLFDEPSSTASVVAGNVNVPTEALTFPYYPETVPFDRILFDSNQGLYAAHLPHAVEDASNTTPIQLTLAADDGIIQAGDTLEITGVLGNTAANGVHVVSEVLSLPNGRTIATLRNTAGNGGFQASPNGNAYVVNEIYIRGHGIGDIGSVTGMVNNEDQHLGAGLKTVDSFGVGLSGGYTTYIRTNESTGDLIVDMDQSVPVGQPLMILRPGTILFKDGGEEEEFDSGGPQSYISGGSGYVVVFGTTSVYLAAEELSGNSIGIFGDIPHLIGPYAQPTMGATVGFRVGGIDHLDAVQDGITASIPPGSTISVRGGIIVGYS